MADNQSRSNLPLWVKEANVQDATRPITIAPNQEHIDRAVQEKAAGNGASCVAAQCLLSALGASEVYFYQTTAYVRWDKDGLVERFVSSHPLRTNVIEPLDNNRPQDIKPGRYDLLPPNPSRKLGVSAAHRAHLKTLRERGEAPPPTKRYPYKPRPGVGRIRSAIAMSKGLNHG